MSIYNGVCGIINKINQGGNKMENLIYAIVGLFTSFIKNDIARVITLIASLVLTTVILIRMVKFRRQLVPIKRKYFFYLPLCISMAVGAVFISGEEPNETERGKYVLDLYTISFDFDPIDENNKPKELVCKKAQLKGIDNNIEYKDWNQIEDDVIFQNVVSGKYKLSITMDGYKEYQRDLDIGVKELESKNIVNNKKSYKYLLLENPVWGEWKEWGEWQNREIKEDIFTEVEIKADKVISEPTNIVHTITYKDKEKPIYEEREVQVGTEQKNVCRATEIDEEKNAQVCSKWELVQTPIMTTVNVIIDYGTSERKYRTMDYSSTKFKYRSRKRSLISGIKETKYATDDSQQYLESIGYVKVYN